MMYYTAFHWSFASKIRTHDRFVWSESLPHVQESDAELDEDSIGDLDELEEDDDAEENV